ncbi:uncharacterized protein LOC122245470 [Penaeus japonicus]|uniref:uncharacterized protein LOC122245470 n=1 Tax=Penaeus japonicus TaxID=27405 RepID=UPI001C70D434|nr:uncharacterized protein LOC122245470 [Penaeus japonicus]
MASHFAWFLYSVLVFLACQDGAHSQNSEFDIQTLEDLSKKVELNGQFGVLFLPGKKQLKDVKCHSINYKNSNGVDGDCKFAGVAPNTNETLGIKETRRHSEWQLIYKALMPMLRKWKEAKSNKGDKINCPESLYLYTRLAPDFSIWRAKRGYTCTQAIVCKIENIFRKASCPKPRIVVGFSEVTTKVDKKVEKEYKKKACMGYKVMLEHDITEYHLTSQLPNKKFDCDDVKVKVPDLLPCAKVIKQTG